MELVELSDLIGAIDCYLKQNHNKSLQDLILFSQITQRAFLNGRRKACPPNTQDTPNTQDIPSTFGGVLCYNIVANPQ